MSPDATVATGPARDSPRARPGSRDEDDPWVRTAALELTAGLHDDRARAVALHDYVRDRIAFGWDRRFDDTTAAEVLEARVGFCNSKATLFVALLRAVGLEARVQVVDLHRDLLLGLIRPPQRYVDHAYTEVRLDGRWLGTDSYVVDRPVHAAAVARCRGEGRAMGYGVHVAGTTTWDGTRDAFSQHVTAPETPTLIGRRYGAFDTQAAFRAMRPRRGVIQRFVLARLTARATHRVRALRASGGEWSG